MTIVIVPPYPQRNSPNFAAEADSWNSQLPTWTDQVNDTAIAVAADAATATTQAGIATTQAGLSATYASNSSTSASQAATSAQTAINAPGTSAISTTSLTIGTGSKTLIIQTGKSFVIGMFVLIAKTSDPVNYMGGQITSYNSNTGELIVTVWSSGGAGTHSDWTISLSAKVLDIATEAEMEAGTETEVKYMSPHLVSLLVNSRVEYQEFTTSGIWNKPANASLVYVEAIGGGGGGAKGNASFGGGGGGFAFRLFKAENLSSSEAVIIGAGGAGATVDNGYDGGNSIFSDLIATGGKAGLNTTLYTDFLIAGRGGDGTTCVSEGGNQYFASGGFGSGSGGRHYMTGGNSMMGGGGGAPSDYTTSTGGISQNAGNGGNYASDGSYPGGGGGSSRDKTPGRGANGRVRILAW